jgi:hypothetical protein
MEIRVYVYNDLGTSVSYVLLFTFALRNTSLGLETLIYLIYALQTELVFYISGYFLIPNLLQNVKFLCGLENQNSTTAKQISNLTQHCMGKTSIKLFY